MRRRFSDSRIRFSRSESGILMPGKCDSPVMRRALSEMRIAFSKRESAIFNIVYNLKYLNIVYNLKYLKIIYNLENKILGPENAILT